MMADDNGLQAATIEPWPIQVPQRDLDELRRRLAETRWPDR